MSLRTCLSLAMLFAASPLFAVPAPVERKDSPVAEPTGFLPNQKHSKLPGKIVAVLIADAAPVLSREDRLCPPGHHCIGWNGDSYKWVYVTEGKQAHANFAVRLADGKIRVFPSVAIARQDTLKPFEIDKPFTLVEIEVNGGDGGQPWDLVVATKIKKVDGTKEYPLTVVNEVERLRKEYDARLLEKQKDLDAAVIASAKKAIKDRDPTGPRQSDTITFVSWMQDNEQLSVRFLTRITDGEYKYANGIRVELGTPSSKLPNGLRYGTQFGIETGVEYLISKTGKVESVRVLEPVGFMKELAEPKVFRGRPVQRRMAD